MPAPKPVALHKRHNTKAEIKAKLDAEASFHPDKQLPNNEPALIKDNKRASVIWRRLIREFDRLEVELVSRLDFDLLIDYCVVMAQIEELDAMRTSSVMVWEELLKEHSELVDKKDFVGARKLVRTVAAAHDAILKVDARTDAKRKLAFSYRQSLFMTPRSRTGVKPPEDQEKKATDDPIEAAFEAALEKKSKESVNSTDGDSGEGA